MNLNTLSLSEFLQPSSPFDDVEIPVAANDWQFYYTEAQPSSTPPDYSSVSDLVSMFEEGDGAERMQDARRWVGESYYGGEEGETIRGMRLAAGYSQADLASRIGTSQPHIARIETGKVDGVYFRTAIKLSEALNVQLEQLQRALFRD